MAGRSALPRTSPTTCACGASGTSPGSISPPGASPAAAASRFAPAGFRETSFLPSYGLAEHVLAATVAPRDRRPLVDVVVAGDLFDERVATPYAGTGTLVSVVSCGLPLPGHALRISGDDGRT